MEAKEVLGVTPDVVDLDVMLNTPVPFAKWQGKEYCIKAATLEQIQDYAKNLPFTISGSIGIVLNDKNEKALKKAFDTHVVCEGESVKYADVKGVWPNAAFSVFVKKLLGISG